MKKILRTGLLLCLTAALLLSAFPVTLAMGNSRAVSVSDVNVPAYVGGNISNWMLYDCGRGATLEDTSVQSKMCIITNTNKVEFNDYVNKLLDSGYTKVFSRKLLGNIKENIFGRFLAKDGSHSVYVALFQYLNQVRIIVDNHKDTLGLYDYAPTGNSPTELYLCSLSQSHDGYVLSSPANMITQYRSGAGSMLLMKMSDNSLFIIDGGSSNQNGDRACEEMYALMRSITGVPEGQRMVINTWYISHPHSDHVTGFPRFLKKYRTEFELKNILYNFDIECDTFNFIQYAAKLFPDVKYHKPHTGEYFTVSGIRFDVLYTAEDRYQPNSSNKLLLNDSSCVAYTHENNISAVLQVQLDGKKVLLTGDLQKADATLMAMYDPSVLKSDVLQIPHHGIDNHTALAKVVAPSVAFSNQTLGATLNQHRYYNNYLGWAPYIGEIYYAGSETVGYSGEKGVFYRKPFTGYDFLSWGGNPMTLGKETPQKGENPVKDPELYYRYTKASSIGTSYAPYIFVDNKVGQVLSFDAIKGGVSSALPSLTDGTDYFFSDSQRRLVQWNIKAQGEGKQADAAVPSATTTYYDRVKIRKGEGDYWGSPAKGHAMTFAEDDSFSATGLYNSWASMSQQLEENTWAIWMDKLPDGSFVIYRYLDGSYYPMYRDGSPDKENGWGISKMSKEKLNSTLDYVKLRLYKVEETPSAMSLSWTGHRDYYAETGINRNDLISLLVADIRVKYSFDAFAGSGEIFHCSRDDQNPGTYWFEFDPGYNADLPGDYAVKIRYKTAKGTVLDIGSFTLHLTEKTPEAPELFFDFGDTDADRDRYYTQSKYGGSNFDGTTRWTTTRKGVNIPHTVNRAEGVLEITVSDWDRTNKKDVSISPYSGGATPLEYKPESARYVQIRYKMNNLRGADNADPFIRLWYNKTQDGTTVKTYDRAYPLGKDFVSDGEYHTVTIPLFTQEDMDANASVSGFPTSTFYQAGTVSGISVGFHDLTADAEGLPGEILVDYIYVGPEESLPVSPFVEDSGLKLNHSLNLASDISVNFLISKAALEGYAMDTVYVESVIDTYTGEEQTGTTTVRMEPVENGDYYYFTLKGLNAVQMNDTIRSTLYGSKNGQGYYSPVDEYSIASYAYSQLNNATRPKKLKTLCADLLRYGTKAQIYKSYRMDALADAAMTELHRSYLSDMETIAFGNTDVTLQDLKTPPVTWVGKALNLETKVELKYVFAPTSFVGDVNDLLLHVSYEGLDGQPKSAIVTKPTVYNAEKGYYAFSFDGLLAAELRSVVSVRIFHGSEPVSHTLRYSADTYGNGKTKELGDLCKALMAYSDSAKAYFAG